MRNRPLLLGIGAVVLVIAAVGVGFMLARLGETPTPTATPSPSPTPTAVTCQVSVTPSTLTVDPDTGQSADVLLLVGAGFPAATVVTVDFGTGQDLDTTSSAAGDISVEIAAEPGVTHPAPPDLEPGPVTWNVGGPCETEVEVAIEYTHEPSQRPPTDLSAGDYAEVIADGVRVRVGPSPDATVVGALYTGDIVHILAPAQVAEGYAWYLVETAVIQSGEALRGYVAAGSGTQAYLVRTEAPPPPTPTPLPSPTASP